jgi:ribosome-associated translation inhibitor RaiA
LSSSSTLSCIVFISAPDAGRLGRALFANLDPHVRAGRAKAFVVVDLVNALMQPFAARGDLQFHSHGKLPELLCAKVLACLQLSNPRRELERDMQTPLKIEFQGMVGTPQLEDAIAMHVAQLEQRWNRITACRVVLKGPGQHHRAGGLYEIHIHLVLPDGREVSVRRTAAADDRRTDLTFALNNAFKRVRRQLQDQRRRIEGNVKHHAGTPSGGAA